MNVLSGIYGQENKGKQKDEEPQSIQELFNTSSCIPKPYRCPHKQIQFFLYTRLVTLDYKCKQNTKNLDIVKMKGVENL